MPLQFQHGGLRHHADGDADKLAKLRPAASRAARCRSGPVTLMVHMASVWVPFTSESKEAVAGYPEIQKEIRLAIQAVGRKLGMYVRRRQSVKQEGERRTHFLALSRRSGRRGERDQRRRTATSCTRSSWPSPSAGPPQADVKLDERGKPVVEDEELDLGENVLIVDHQVALDAITEPPPQNEIASTKFNR